MKSTQSIQILSILSFALLAGCNDQSANSQNPSPSGGTSPVVAQPTPVKVDTNPNGFALGDVLSDSAVQKGVTIKRLSLGQSTMDVLDPNPRGANSNSQTGSLVLALCGPRFSDESVSTLGNTKFPLVLSANSQILMRRDLSYRFGDGTSASTADPYVLMTCKNNGFGTPDTLSSTAGNSKVQVKHLHAYQTTMELIDPNIQGSSRHQSGNLILVMCTPRATDKNLSRFADSAYPILLTEGSQLEIKRDTNYRFGDGSTSSSAEAQVILSCE